MKIKRCPGCKQSKHVSEFNRSSRNKDGCRPYCRQCEKARYRENRENILARMKEYQYKNKDKIRESKRKYLQSPAGIKAKQKYVRENKDKIREYNRRYLQSPAGINAKRKWKKVNREKLNARRRERYANDPEYRFKNLARSQKRYSLRRGASTAELVDRQTIMGRDEATCYICGKGPLDNSEIHLDHVIPVSKGGSHTPDNLKVACASCNHKKHDKSLAEVRERIAQGKW